MPKAFKCLMGASEGYRRERNNSFLKERLKRKVRELTIILAITIIVLINVSDN